MTQTEIKVSPDPAALTHEAAERIVAAGQAKLAEDGAKFSLVLSGGSTPKALFELLTTPPYNTALDWARVEIYFGDERTVGPEHADSNYGMAKKAMLTKLPIPEKNVFRMRGEIPPEEAAKEYGLLLKAQFGEGGADLVLLGMGDDGHTASLFPETTALDETHHRCVANYVAKMNTWRITMTYPFLNKSSLIMILVAGASKAKRLAEVLEGPKEPKRLPIQGIAPENGKLVWLLDVAAAEMEEAE